MRIAYLVTRTDSIGGALIHVRDMSAALLAQGHEVTVLAGGEGAFTRELQQRKIPCISLCRLSREINPFKDISALVEIRKALKTVKPEIISAHMSKAGLLGRLAGKSVGIPVIFTAHGWSFTEGVPAGKRRFYLLAEKAAAPLTDSIITVSGHDRGLAEMCGVGRRQKIVVVHNGVFDIQPDLLANPGKEKPRLVMVARFEEQKDHQTLIQALSGLKDLEWDIDLVGDGPLEAQVADMVKTFGLEERVRFLGAREDVADILSKAQLFLLISNWEGFPRSILEAMRAGLPVVASDVGGARESVADCVTGFLIPRKDSALLRDRLRTLLRDPQLRICFGEAGRKRYEESFTFDKMYEKTLQVYRQVLGRDQL
jgi:glycosyltransferase involved in cell wall biosynthesis